MKIIYLAAYKAFHSNYNIIYQDINGKRDLDGDMLDIDLSFYDILIATPPCNYYSRANYRREKSVYSQNTKDLLPKIIDKFILTGKPFIVENVINKPLMNKYKLFDKNCFVYFIGRHTYWTNIFLPSNILQEAEIVSNIKFLPQSKRQGGKNVYYVIEQFLELVYGN